MKGAESLLTTANAAGIEICFANPGTTEMPLVEAFDQVRGIRTILGLSEGVVTGAADGYTRMASAPALTLLHLGPGFANGIANLHNARRARTPVINIIGEHASWHQAADAPLATDIESLAHPVSGWVGRTSSAEAAAANFMEARQAALSSHLPSTLIAAADHMWSQGGTPVEIPPSPRLPKVDEQQVASAAKALSHHRPVLLLGGNALSAEGIRTAARIAYTTGARLFAERSPARIERGPDIPPVQSLPYFPEDVMGVLEECSDVVLAGTVTPVSFFGYRGMPSIPLPSHTRTHTLAGPGEDAAEALTALAEATQSTSALLPEPERPDVPVPESTLTASSVAAAIVLIQPEQAIVVNEGVTSAASYPALASAAPQHTELTLTGGAIGMGIPAATGAALACPDRSVIDFQADGSAFYTVQGLWTQARENLDVTTVICANSRYRILEAELGRAGVSEPGTAARNLTSLGGPAPDWTELAAGFGVPATRASTGPQLCDALRRAQGESGPHLIHAVME